MGRSTEYEDLWDGVGEGWRRLGPGAGRVGGVDGRRGAVLSGLRNVGALIRRVGGWRIDAAEFVALDMGGEEREAILSYWTRGVPLCCMRRPREPREYAAAVESFVAVLQAQRHFRIGLDSIAVVLKVF